MVVVLHGSNVKAHERRNNTQHTVDQHKRPSYRIIKNYALLFFSAFRAWTNQTISWVSALLPLWPLITCDNRQIISVTLHQRLTFRFPRHTFRFPLVARLFAALAGSPWTLRFCGCVGVMQKRPASVMTFLWYLPFTVVAVPVENMKQSKGTIGVQFLRKENNRYL